MPEPPWIHSGEMEPAGGDGPRIRPTVVGPIVGPPVIIVDGPIVTRPPVPNGEQLPWSAPAAVPRRLTDLPDAESFVAPDVQGLYGSIAADTPMEPRTDLAPYVPYTSPETPPDPELFNILQ